jgi:hypothetical protein
VEARLWQTRFSLFNPGVAVIDRRLNRVPGFLDQIVRIVRNPALSQVTNNLEFRYSELVPEAGVLKRRY